MKEYLINSPSITHPISNDNLSEQTNPHTSIGLISICVALVFLAINMRTPIVMIGSIVPIIEHDLSITQTQIGWLGALPMFMFAFGAFISARLSRRFGVHLLLPAMIALLITGMVLRVVVLNWWLFFSGTLILSLAIGLLNTLAMPAIKQLAPNHIPLVTGLFSFTLSVFAGISAGVIVPISELIGWQLASASWAVISVVAFVLWRRLSPALQQVNPVSGQHNRQKQDTSNTLETLNMWKLPMAWYLAIFLGVQSLLYYVVASFLPSIWIDKGLSLIQAGQLAMLFQLISPVAIVLLTWLMNRSVPTINTTRWIAMIASLLIVIGTAGITFGSYDSLSTVKILIWATLWTGCMGLGAALVFTLCLMLIPLRTYNAQQAGELSSMAQSVAYTIAIFGPLGVGWLHEQTGSWQLPLTLITVLMVINMIFAWLSSRAVMIDGKG